MSHDSAGTIAALEAIAETRTLVEDVSRLAEDLKTREERLERLLVPSEAALRARSEYLEKVLREELGQAAERTTRLCQDVEKLTRSLGESVRETTSRLEAVDARREQARRGRDRWRAFFAIVLLLIGGFLAGELAQYRARADAKPAVREEQKTSTARPKPLPKPAR